MKRIILTVFVGVFLAGYMSACKDETPPDQQTSAVSISSGRVVLPSGYTAEYETHYDRNALNTAYISESGIIAITRSGTLLRYDSQTLQATGELITPGYAVCLGKDGAGGPLVGFEDGTIWKVDVQTMKLSEIGKVGGIPLWIGSVASSDNVKDKFLSVIELPGGQKKRGSKKFAIYILGEGRAIEFMGPWSRYSLTSFMADSKGRLWLGEDRGEWGGVCYLFDLKCRALYETDSIPSGIYGFAELADGRVICYGGTMHFFLFSRFISDLNFDGKTLNAALLLHNRINLLKNKEKDPELYSPITKILQEDDASELIVFSYGNIFRVTSDFKKWELVGHVKFRYRPWKSYAAGTNPAIRQVFLKGRGLDDGLVCITTRDGIVLWLHGKLKTQTCITNQVGLSGVYRIRRSDIGLLMQGSSDELPWSLSDGIWKQADIVPPFKPSLFGGNWQSYELLVRRDGSLLSMWSSGRTSALVEWRKGKTMLVHKDINSRLWINSVFTTPDGGVWAADDRVLRRFDGARWLKMHDLKNTIWGLETVNDSGPPWLLLGNYGIKREFVRLSYGRGFKDAKLENIQLVDDDDKSILVHDAIPWDNNQTLLVTSAGLRLISNDSNNLQDPQLKKPDGSITQICRDGNGRLWLGGNGLWLLENGKVIDVTAVPMIGKNTVYCMERDPDDPWRIAVGLGEQGVTFVRVVSNKYTKNANKKIEIDN